MLLRQLERQDADLTAIPFNQASKNGLFETFLDVIGSDQTNLEQSDEIPRVNPNSGAKAVFVGRQVAAELERLGLNPRAHRDIFVAFKNEYTKRNWHLEAYSGLDDQIAKQIEMAYAKSNDEIAEKLWGKAWGEVITPNRGLERNEFHLPEYRFWADRDVRKVLRKLFGMISRIEN